MFFPNRIIPFNPSNDTVKPFRFCKNSEKIDRHTFKYLLLDYIMIKHSRERYYKFYKYFYLFYLLQNNNSVKKKSD